MLKKIRVDQVRLGMHLHALEGAWIDHPFWKTKFVVADTDDLRKLRDSSVREVWIDVAKGLDVATPEAPGDAAASAAAARPLPATLAATPAERPAAPTLPRDRAPSTSLDEELQAAAAICNSGKRAVFAMFKEARMGRAVDAEGAEPLVNEISSSVMRNPGALVSLARLKTQDEYTFMHSVAVCALMVALGRELGLDEAGCRAAGLGGLMHDLGKAAIPPEILNKPGKLTDAEFDIVKSHPVHGHAMLVEGKGATPELLDVCLHHHEKMDGSGYPERLAGDAISRMARMGAVCDVYDAVTSNRPYKAGWDPAESIARMATWKGHFDGEVFAAFVRSLGIFPIGSLVRLHSGRLAVVVGQNPASLTAPTVKVFFSTKSNMPIPVQTLELASGTDRIVGRESVQAWGFKQLDALWIDPALLPKVGG